MAWPDLFELTDLPSWLQVPSVDTETAIRVRRYANGWLMSACRLASWPNPIPDDLFAWGIKLAGIAFRNPTGAASMAIDDYNVSFDAARREQILKAAASAYGSNGAPLYRFPEPDWSWTVVPSTVAE